jgi:hypothetical protein
MKQFLLDKLNSLSQEVLLEFNNSITNNLPSNSRLTKIWGTEENGFWFIDEYSAWYFEDHGIHHSIDTYRNSEFSTFVKMVNDSNEYNIVPTHLEFEELKLENLSHPFIFNGTTLYYNKFVNPRNNYGTTLQLDFMLGTLVGKNDEITEKFFNFFEKSSSLENQYSERIKKIQADIHKSSDYIDEYQNGFTVLRDQEGYFFSKVGWATGTERLYNKYLNDSSLKERMKYIWTKSAT